VGPRAGLGVCGKSRPHRDSIHGPSIPQRVAILTELSRHAFSMVTLTVMLGTSSRIMGKIRYKIKNILSRVSS
jgi:hypothetical protein